eukprot:symbB.v1.2.027905.t1/scaffold2899.1/size67670/5
MGVPGGRAIFLQPVQLRASGIWGDPWELACSNFRSRKCRSTVVVGEILTAIAASNSRFRREGYCESTKSTGSTSLKRRFREIERAVGVGATSLDVARLSPKS